MEQETTYILMGIVALLIIMLLLAWVRRKKAPEKMSKLAQISFVFIFAGIIFNQDRFIGYGLMTVGGILAIIDIARKLRNKN